MTTLAFNGRSIAQYAWCDDSLARPLNRHAAEEAFMPVGPAAYNDAANPKLIPTSFVAEAVGIELRRTACCKQVQFNSLGFSAHMTFWLWELAMLNRSFERKTETEKQHKTGQTSQMRPERDQREN